MDYVCGPLILYSQDKIRMLDFLSDVFEFDIDLEEDLVHSGSMRLKLVELPEAKKNDFHTDGVTFLFKLKTTDQLKEILSKYNFFLYRKESSHLKEQIDRMESETLSIKDIDGRVWQFDVEASL